LFTQQAYEEAIHYYLEAVRINPEFSQPYNQLGYCYRYLGNYVKAEESFKKYIKMIPDDPNPYDSYAELLLKMGEYEVSIEMYEKALELDPDFSSPYIGIATNLNLKHEHAEARKQLMDLFRRAENNADRRYALIGMVVSFVDEENYPKAISIMNKSIALCEEQGDVAEMASMQQLLAYLLLEFGKIDESIEAFHRARDFVEQSDLSEEIKRYASQRYVYGRARIAIAKGDLSRADSALIEYRNKAEANENPGMIRAAHELAGLIAMERQNYQDAIREFNQANQQDPYTFYRIAEAYLNENELNSALEYYQRAAQFNALNSINYALIRQRAVKKTLRIKTQLSAPLSSQL
jgi:tetratricopeptide (TPR) repeat protein